MTEEDSGYDVPDALLPENITATRKQALQLLYEEPNHTVEWYDSKLNTSSFIVNLRSYFPNLIEKSGFKNSKGKYSLRDEAVKALLDAGVIEPDELAESRRTVIVPGEEQERGNVKTKGAIDLTGLSPDEGSIQAIQDRPKRSTTATNSDSGAADETGGAQAAGEPSHNGEVISEGSDTPGALEASHGTLADDDDTVTVTLTRSDVYELIRHGPMGPAKRLFVEATDSTHD